MKIFIPFFYELDTAEAEAIDNTFIWFKLYNRHTFKITYDQETNQSLIESTGPQTESDLLSK